VYTKVFARGFITFFCMLVEHDLTRILCGNRPVSHHSKEALLAQSHEISDAPRPASRQSGKTRFSLAGQRIISKVGRAS
jgi:hypothetical protein